MSNSLQWSPRITELRALAALLSLGVAFFGEVLRRGGRALAPQPVLGGILVALGVAGCVLVVWRALRLRRVHTASRRAWTTS